MKEWGCRGIFIPKLALRTVLNHKSCFLELLPNLPCLHISLFSFLTVLYSSSGKLHHHGNRKANNASMFLSFFHFVSRAASSSTSSPSDSLFCPPHLPHIFLVYDPPHHHLPLHSHAVFSGTEQMRSCAFCLQINRPRSPLSRAAEAASSLCLAVQYEQGRAVEMGETQGC